MRSPRGCWHSQQTRLVASKSRSPSFTALQPVSFAQQLGRCNNRARLQLLTRHRHSVLTLAAAKPQSQREGPEKTNFFTKLIRPLRDFGLGKSSLWEGGVGLFIFAGIGMQACFVT